MKPKPICLFQLRQRQEVWGDEGDGSTAISADNQLCRILSEKCCRQNVDIQRQWTKQTHFWGEMKSGSFFFLNYEGIDVLGWQVVEYNLKLLKI